MLITAFASSENAKPTISASELESIQRELEKVADVEAAAMYLHQNIPMIHNAIQSVLSGSNVDAEPILYKTDRILASVPFFAEIDGLWNVIATRRYVDKSGEMENIFKGKKVMMEQRN